MFRIFSEWLRVFYIGLALGSQSIAWTSLALASSSRDYTYSNATSAKIAIYLPPQKKKTTTLVQIEIKSQLCSRNSTKNTRSTHFSPTIRLCAIPSVMVVPLANRADIYVSPSPHSAMKKWILFLLLLLSLSACSRHISEHIAVHDTLRLALTDTIREHITLTDSV